MEKMIVKEEIVFNAKPEKVWELLTNPEMTKQYMFGCEIVSSYEIGSPIEWKGRTENGDELIYVTGKILEYEEGKKIVSNTFDPNSTMEDLPVNYVNMSYELELVEKGTKLTIIQGDFSAAENGAQRYEESKKGWVEMVIPMMKKLMGE